MPVISRPFRGLASYQFRSARPYQPGRLGSQPGGVLAKPVKFCSRVVGDAQAHRW